LGEAAGLVKTIFDAVTGELLGAHLVGPEVTELIQGFATAMGHETTDEHLLRIIYPHPTLSEAMHEAVLDSIGRAIHI
jgi:dihydrolipoamide dehydrogenase